MQVGDLIKFEPKPNEYPQIDNRRIGAVIKTDYYTGSMGTELIIEVLWQNGQCDWILAERVELVS